MLWFLWFIISIAFIVMLIITIVKAARRKKVKGALISTIVLFVTGLICFIVAIASIPSSSDDTENTSDTNKTYKVGDTVKADGVDVTLSKAEYVTPSSEDDAGDPENGKALKVYFKFKNHNEDQVLVQDNDFSMKVDGENYENWYGNGDTSDGFSHQLNKDNTGSGYITYDVPDSDKYTVEMDFTPNLDTVKAKWNIDKSEIQQN
ncbi:DUF4352 domain-containing protein [Staphylococcus saprophyticus]|uniref:DUF4352 domain-containing protein n=1 Tax=Staphylococcus saprophyticus TaxID=29385 RepID=UPI002DB8D233|nr:DUF4352 domain-containing protein [Staphylococcus saprophyticus]MEB7675583.1 DUF4352 domain-containing protein [Staphylococcus saprophyticus]